MASDDEDVPESGAVFTFGKTRFADNLASKFWIRDDPVVQIACGDEHSAVITAKGKLYTFGSNDWGQLGHGNTKPYNKPSVVKKLKPEKSYLVACGRNHTLVATESGRLYSFGCGGDGQLGHDDTESTNVPRAIESLDNQSYSILACGSDFSAAVTDEGILYTWGSNSEGQNGMGEDTESPKRLYINGKVVSVACGYYHMAVVTDDGSLYTCGEQGGKLGLERSQMNDTSQLQKVESIKENVICVSCGAEFTVAVTQGGHVYSFGQGNQGQLGLGSVLTDCDLPEKLKTFNKVKAKSVGCGESFTSIITKHGNLYTFGDGRHGKLGLGDECFSNLFKPQKVTRFNNFIVTKVSCGGCHMLVSAVKKDESVDMSDSEEDAEKATLAATITPNQFLDAVDGPSHLSASWSARDKRRQKHVEDINKSLSHSLPPINKSSLPPLNGTIKHALPALGKSNLSEEDKNPVNPLNVSKLPKISHGLEEDSQTTSIPKPLPRGLPKPPPLAAPRALPRSRKEREETESEEESGSEEEESEEGDNDRKNKKVENEEFKRIEESERKVKKQEGEEESEEDESEDDEEEEEESKRKEGDKFKKVNENHVENKNDKMTKQAMKAKDDDEDDDEDDDDEEEEEEDEDEDEEDDENEEEDEDYNKNKKKSKENIENKKGKKIEVKSSNETGEKEREEEKEVDNDKEESKDTKKKRTKQEGNEVDKEKTKKGKKKSKDEDKDIEGKETKEESPEKSTKSNRKGKRKKKEEAKEKEEEEEEDEEDEESDKEKPVEDNKDSEKPKITSKQKEKKSGICNIL